MGSLPATAAATNVLINPAQPERVYAADATSIYRSDDAGQTWQAASQGLPNGGIAALSLDPRQPQRLYAATAGSLFLSEDGGTIWDELPGAATDAAT